MPDLTLGELRSLMHEMRGLPDETVLLTPLDWPASPDPPSGRHRVFGMFIESNIDTFRRQLALLPDVTPATARRMAADLAQELRQAQDKLQSDIAAAAEVIRADRQGAYPRHPRTHREPGLVFAWLRAFCHRHPEITAYAATEALNLVHREEAEARRQPPPLT